LKKAALFTLLTLVSVGFVSCSGGYSIPKPPSGLYQRVLASQGVSSLTSNPGLVIVNGQTDMLAPVAPISAGSSPGLMVLSSTRATLLAFDSNGNNVEIVDTIKESVTGAVRLPGATTSIVLPATETFAYAAVPTAPLTGAPPGAVEIMNLTAGAIALAVSVPNAQTVVANPNGTQLLAFSNDSPSGSASDVVTIITPSLSTNPPTASTIAVPGFDRPVYGFFVGDVVYILNCGTQCGGKSQASVQILNLGATPSAGASVPVDGATMGFISGSTLFVAGTSPTNNACAGEKTAAKTCGRLDIVDLGSLTVTGSAVITDGYHTVMSESANGQLFIGASTCTNVGNVNAPQGEVRGCLSIYNTTNGEVVIPPDNGDVTDLQSFTSRFVEYVAEGGNLRVYDTTHDALLVDNIDGTVINGIITITGQVIGVKAIDFF